ncbi:MAG: AbrB family transcriptional regulator [Pseudolabrys sp.]|nr:AbrB family transcriptional regulator [Pseudolabrys sp.]
MFDRLLSFRDVGETMMFACLGGLLFGLIGVPAGYLSGSILGVACAALAGRPMRVPVPMMQVLLVLIGISLGAVVTPETLRGMATYPVSIGVLIVATAVISFVGTAYLRAVHRFDLLTAYLAATPGGLSQVMALAIEFKADVRAIVIVQTVRVVIVAIGFPLLLSAIGLGGETVQRTIGGTFEISDLGELAVLIAACTIVAILAYKVRFPGGLLFGAMLTSAALHGSGILHVVMPWWVAYTVMMFFGAVAGSRFAGTPVQLLLRFVGAAFGSFATALVITAIFAGLLVQLLPLPLAEVMIAYAPGAVDAMLLLALALNLDPVYVGAHHLTRIFLVMATTPLIVRHRISGPVQPDAPEKPATPQRPFED